MSVGPPCSWIDVKKLEVICKKQNRCGAKARRRWRILERDGFRCVLCGSSEKLTIDHRDGVKKACNGKRNYGAQAWKLAECRTLCIECHRKINEAKNGRT